MIVPGDLLRAIHSGAAVPGGFLFRPQVRAATRRVERDLARAVARTVAARDVKRVGLLNREHMRGVWPQVKSCDEALVAVMNVLWEPIPREEGACPSTAD
ncbi:hypothetical protein [Paludisphaera mucosa]|uniref:Uncharacterized protein n=1 Tax=Paludisphaera mucosa TaxID=3030827 RepID=A0ABT6F5Q2_9BACT|nr:hypothetical protein [Paludisphaera mucosa]MDG3002852.1 hypothetical protein [Paludisphaera mucosa]